MLRVLGLVLSVGLADSMNPSTVAPALYLATGEASLRELIQFTLGVFWVCFVGGGILVFGPGQALLALVPHPSATTRYILELIAGTVMLAGGLLVWRRREPLRRKSLPDAPKGRRGSAMLGATIALVELPTAFPYFAAIAAIVGSGLGITGRLVMLAIYNVCFVAPLLAIIATVAIFGEDAGRILQRARDWLQRHWPELVSGLAVVAGAFILALGVTGLTSAGHGPLARFSRRLRRTLTSP